MANRGREYAESIIGPLDRSAYNQQRDVVQNTYNTNWQNVQNQYKNLQDKLKLRQEQANKDFAEGLVDVAEKQCIFLSVYHENVKLCGGTIKLC